MVKKLLKPFMKKNCKKQVNQTLENKLEIKWKGLDNLFNSWVDKKDIVKWIYKKWVNTWPYETFGGNINVKVDLSNYRAKADLKNATGFDTSKLVLKWNLANLKVE